MKISRPIHRGYSHIDSNAFYKSKSIKKENFKKAASLKQRMDEGMTWEKIAFIIFIAGCVIVLLVFITMVAMHALIIE